MKIILPFLIIALGVFVIFYPTIAQQNPIGSLTVSRGQAVPTPTPMPENWLLPDMKLEPPSEMYIRTSNGVKELRFNTTFANIGKGPMELIGNPNEDETATIASQKIYKTDGTTEDQVVGEFIYHPTHDHWHVDKYAQFFLFNPDENGLAKDLVGQTDKFSFCLWDEHRYDLTIPNAPQTRQYPRCPKNIQGNSVGWGDTYTAGTDGQSVDITNLPDGRYLFRSIVNADSKILETDYSNNEAIGYIEILGNTVKILENFQD